MKSEVKSFGLLLTTLLLSFSIDLAHSADDTTPLPTTPLSETTQGYDNPKCVSHFKYKRLIDSFIKQTASDIQQNRSRDAMETLNKLSPTEDDRFVKDIIREALKQPDVKLFHLLEFLNQTKLPMTKLNGLSDIFSYLKNTKEKPERFSFIDYGPSKKTVFNWLDLEYFTRYFCDGHVNISEISTEATRLLSDVQDKAKSIVLRRSLKELLIYYSNKEDNVTLAWEHLHFIIKAYYNHGTTIANIIQHVEPLHPPSGDLMCWSITALYTVIESNIGGNSTFQVMPLLKLVSERRPTCLENLKLSDGSIFQKIFSENYFHLKNAYNNQYLYGKRSGSVMPDGNRSFIIKTVSETDSDEINWKFGVFKHTRSDRIVLTIENENFERKYLRALPCLVQDGEFVVQMEHGKIYNEHFINDAWSIEVDDVDGDRFRIKNELSKSYLAVSLDSQSAVILVNALKAENYDSVHWTLEMINEDLNSI